MKEFDIVIISLNEEETLPGLLKSIRMQDISPKKIIVADANSSDNTVKIAKKAGCVVVPGGKSPGEGRNIGASFAKSPMILFLDADVILPKRFIKTCINYMKKEKIDAACVSIEPDTNKKIDKFLLNVYNIHQKLTQHFWAHGVGACIFCKKKFFEELKGFDQAVRLGEDHEFVKRAAKKGKYRIIPGVHIKFSMRRFETDGRIFMALQNVLGGFHRLLFGEVKNKKVQNKIIRYPNRKDWLKKNSK
jgi:glycosyltransferase involved in cell wall biosynthesis